MRTQLITPNLKLSELQCKDAPIGQLKDDASLAEVSLRIIAIDEAGEDCRQKLRRAYENVRIFKEVVAERNKQNGVDEKEQND